MAVYHCAIFGASRQGRRTDNKLETLARPLDSQEGVNCPGLRSESGDKS